MPAITTIVTDYKIRAQANGSIYSVIVDCYRHGQQVGFVFFEQNRTVSEASVTGGTPRIVLRYPVDLFGPIVDMLRYEKPIIMSINGSHNSGSIGTQGEPVGDNEPS
ncbi:hypothetical protein [Neolewinella persica]|uniref:hypothetical protein n=1 Tax=Neolewinella persica TaxID=70998 RepID=UPI0003605E40|nr:hypothetical protein [Neolewinella persica]